MYHVEQVGGQRTHERNSQKLLGSRGITKVSEWTLTSEGKASEESEKDDGDHKQEEASYATTYDLNGVVLYTYLPSAKFINPRDLENQAQVSGRHAFGRGCSTERVLSYSALID